jgi:MFS family permease
VGAICLGAGLGALYPVTLGMIGERFRNYHPGFFNGLLSLSLMGGMLAPWSVGLLAHSWGIEWAVWVPALGIGMVYLLLAVLVLEERLSRIADTASST